MSQGIDIEESRVKDWITFVEKSSAGVTVSSGNTIVFKNNLGDIIVADSYKVLPKAIHEDLEDEGNQLAAEVEEFLKCTDE